MRKRIQCLILAEAVSLKKTPLEPIAAMLKKATQYQRPWQIDIRYNKVMSELMPDEGGLPAFIQKEKHYFAEVFERGVNNVPGAENDQWILGHYTDYVPSVRDEHFYGVLKALSSLEDDYKAAIETYRKTAQNARGINIQFAAEKVLTAILEQDKHRDLQEIAPELIATAEKTFQRISRELVNPSQAADYNRPLPAYNTMHPAVKEDEYVEPDPKKLSGDPDARYPGKASRSQLAGTNEDPPEDTATVRRAIDKILKGGGDNRSRHRRG